MGFTPTLAQVEAGCADESRTEGPRMPPMIMSSTKLAILLLALPALACDSKPAQTRAPPKTAESSEPAPKVSERPENAEKQAAAPAAEAAPDRVLIQDMFPGREEETSLSLTAKSVVKVKLYDEPGGDPSGELNLEKGKSLKPTKTAVIVTKPTVAVAKRAFALRGNTLDAATGELADGETEKEVEAGERVYMYHYGTEGLCYVGTGSTVLLTACPKADDVDLPTKPQELEFWATSSEGADLEWFRVEDAVIAVDVKSTM